MAIEDRVDELTERVDALEADVRSMMSELGSDVRQMRQDLETVREVLLAYNNVKGFLSTVRFIGVVLKVLATIGAIAAAIWYFGKTGQWTWPK